MINLLYFQIENLSSNSKIETHEGESEANLGGW